MLSMPSAVRVVVEIEQPEFPRDWKFSTDFAFAPTLQLRAPGSPYLLTYLGLFAVDASASHTFKEIRFQLFWPCFEVM